MGSEGEFYGKKAKKGVIECSVVGEKSEKECK